MHEFANNGGAIYFKNGALPITENNLCAKNSTENELAKRVIEAGKRWGLNKSNNERNVEIWEDLFYSIAELEHSFAS